jgi:hypothetical protein
MPVRLGRRLTVLLLAVVATGMVGCDASPPAMSGRMPPARDEPPSGAVATPLSATDLAAYVAGTRGAIAALRRGESGDVDSIAAAVAGVPVERYRAIAQTVETTLKRGPQLDSLRVELLVLRVRAEGTP